MCTHSVTLSSLLPTQTLSSHIGATFEPKSISLVHDGWFCSILASFAARARPNAAAAAGAAVGASTGSPGSVGSSGPPSRPNDAAFKKDAVGAGFAAGWSCGAVKRTGSSGFAAVRKPPTVTIFLKRRPVWLTIPPSSAAGFADEGGIAGVDHPFSYSGGAGATASAAAGSEAVVGADAVVGAAAVVAATGFGSGTGLIVTPFFVEKDIVEARVTDVPPSETLWDSSAGGGGGGAGAVAGGGGGAVFSGDAVGVVVFVVVTETVAGTDWITSGPPPSKPPVRVPRRLPPLAAGFGGGGAVVVCALGGMRASGLVEAVLDAGMEREVGRVDVGMLPLPRAAPIGGRGSADGCTATPSGP